MKKLLIFIVVVIVAVFGYWMYNKQKIDAARSITTYEACVDAGYTVVDGTPNRCLTPDGRTLEEGGEAMGSVDLLGGTYRADPSMTVVYWEGRKKLVEGYVDRGTIQISTSSVIMIQDGVLATSSVVFDMTSIAVESTGRGSGESMLTNHLKSDDFFNAEEYPISTFELTEAIVVEGGAPGEHNLRGDLTIRDVTREIIIPARITMDGETLVITGEVMVNRTEFNVKFGSTSFFKELADNAIVEDEFKLIFTVKAVQ